MTRPTQILINLSALRHNFERVRALAPRSRIMAMVKANAYGHGLECVAQALPAADAFGVASLEEGVRLRQAGITQPIVLMEGLFYPEELAEAAQQQFTLVVHHREHVMMLEKKPHLGHFPVWLKIDTGMHRLGFQPEEVAGIYQRLMDLGNIQKPLGLMTHFAEADDLASAATRQQINLFNSVTANLAGMRSLANSSGILGWPDSHGDWVRPGIMLFGAAPIQHKLAAEYQLEPVMTLASQLIAIHPVKKGDHVGYGSTWTATRDTTVGVVAVGYGDGYPQFAPNGTPVLVNGKLCPLIGRVSMDMLTVDLFEQPHAAIGDPVILWGAGLPVEQVAESCHSSCYELLTRMTPRPKMVLQN